MQDCTPQNNASMARSSQWSPFTVPIFSKVQCEKLQKITLLKPFFKKLREILIQQLVFSLHTFQMWVKFMIFNTVRWEQEKLFFLTSSDENEQNRDKKLHLKQRRPHTCSHFQMISYFFSESNRNSFSKMLKTSALKRS